MYEELKERCRACSQGCIYPSECSYFTKPPFKCMRQLLSEAADAIEEMNRRRTPMKITEIHVDEYFCPACGAENNCDQGCVQDAYCPVCGQRLWAEQPKEE